MQPMLFGNNLGADWVQETDGDGTFVLSTDGKFLTVGSSVTGGGGIQNRSYIRQYIQVRGGELIRLKAVCRSISGLSLMFIDYPERGKAASRKEITFGKHDQFQEHEILFQVPTTVDEADTIVSVGLGSTLSNSGTMEIASASVEVEGGNSGATRTLCLGRVDIAKSSGGVITTTLNLDHVSTGIHGVVATTTGATLTTPKMDTSESEPDKRFLPTFSTAISSPNIFGITAYVGEYSPSLGKVDIILTQGTSVYSLSSMANSTSISVYFKAEIA